MQQSAFILKLLTDKHYPWFWNFFCHIFKSCAIFYGSNWQKNARITKNCSYKKKLRRIALI